MNTRIPEDEGLSTKQLNSRKIPSQSRSVETVRSILESAARVLEQEALAGYTTNRVAERAGVSIGSLYQYFPNKDSLTAALIHREMDALLGSLDTIRTQPRFRKRMQSMIRAAVMHQMRRPKLARVIDFEERRLPLGLQMTSISHTLHAALREALECDDAPTVQDSSIAAFDLLAIIKGIVDSAGERQETDATNLEVRVERAVFGYLRG